VSSALHSKDVNAVQLILQRGIIALYCDKRGTVQSSFLYKQVVRIFTTAL